MPDEDLDIRMFVDGEGPPDLDPYFAEIVGAEAIAQSIALRCYTPKGYAVGHNIDAPNDGIFLPDFVQSTVTKQTMFTVKTLVLGEVRKDDRVESARVDVTYAAETQTMRVAVEGVAITGEAFAFGLDVTSNGVTVAETT
ncbi:hypothetical protein WMF30_10420 [Sorangium sp. So ce134]